MREFNWECIQHLGLIGHRLVQDSRKVQEGDVFVAARGEHVDGRMFIPQAITRGASCVLWDSDGFAWNDEWRVPNVAIPHLRARLGSLVATLLGDPSAHMHVVGVTGTNGKTSISQWYAQAMNGLGHRTGVMGTVGHGFPGALQPSTHTTPDAMTTQQCLAQLQAQGASHVAMEVSSHGLDQYRVHGVHFAVAVLSNLTRDHLDYHKTMAHYRAAKTKLFQWPGLQTAVLNLDDEFGQDLAQSLSDKPVQVLTYGVQESYPVAPTLWAKSWHVSANGLQAEVQTPAGCLTLRSPMLGRFNLSNLLAVLAAMLASGVEAQAAMDALAQVTAAPGRMQRVPAKAGPLVIVDYAHTPDALDQVLQTLRECMQGRGALWCVFGCGGDRDAGKRPLMGQAAERWAHHLCLTTDNPRTENPLSIIRDIQHGLRRPARVEPDRAEAIKQTILQAGADDVVLVAGKGHEDYQEIMGRRLPFSDLSVAESALSAWTGVSR